MSSLLVILAIWLAASIVVGLFMGRLLAVTGSSDRRGDLDVASADCVCAATDPSEVAQD